MNPPPDEHHIQITDYEYDLVYIYLRLPRKTCFRWFIDMVYFYICMFFHYLFLKCFMTREDFISERFGLSGLDLSYTSTMMNTSSTNLNAFRVMGYTHVQVAQVSRTMSRDVLTTRGSSVLTSGLVRYIVGDILAKYPEVTILCAEMTALYTYQTIQLQRHMESYLIIPETNIRDSRF